MISRATFSHSGRQITHLPSGDGIFDVVACGIDEDPALIPGPTLDANVLMNVTQSLQFAVTDDNGCKRQRA